MNTSAFLTCPRCNSPLETAIFNQPELKPCASCGTGLHVVVFPAFYKQKPQAPADELVVDEAEASCYFHPQKRAATPCDSCGRFLCALCDVEIGGEHRCPDCLEKGIRKEKIQGLENRRYLYDTLALQLVLFPVLMFPIMIFTAPAALYVIVRYWKKPLGLMRRSRWRFIVAGLIALVEIVGCVFFYTNIWGAS